MGLCALVNHIMGESMSGDFELPDYSHEALRCLCRSLTNDAYNEYNKNPPTDPIVRVKYIDALTNALRSTAAYDEEV